MPFFNRESDSTILKSSNASLIALNSSNLGALKLLDINNFPQNTIFGAGIYNHTETSLQFSNGLGATNFGFENTQSSGWGYYAAKVENGSERIITQAEVTLNSWVIGWNTIPGLTKITSLSGLPIVYTGTENNINRIGLKDPTTQQNKEGWQSFRLEQLDTNAYIIRYLSIFPKELMDEKETFFTKDGVEIDDTTITSFFKLVILSTLLNCNSENGCVPLTGTVTNLYWGSGGSRYFQGSLHQVSGSKSSMLARVFSTGVIFAGTDGIPITSVGNFKYIDFSDAFSITEKNLIESVDRGGNRNTVFGWWSQQWNTTGRENTTVGFQAARKNTTGSHNVTIGHNSARENNHGSENVTIGWGASEYTGNANSSVTIGWDASKFSVINTESVTVGWQAAKNSGFINQSVVLGYSAGQFVSPDLDPTIPPTLSITNSGVVTLPRRIDRCTLLGWGAASNTPTMRDLIAIGWGAAGEGGIFDHCQILGWKVGNGWRASSTFAAGWEHINFTGQVVSDSILIGYGNAFHTRLGVKNSILLGTHAGYKSREHINNVGIGIGALQSEFTGGVSRHNTAIGHQSGNTRTQTLTPIVNKTTAADVKIIEYFYPDQNYAVGDLVYSFVLVTSSSEDHMLKFVWICTTAYTGTTAPTTFINAVPTSNFEKLNNVGQTITSKHGAGGIGVWVNLSSSDLTALAGSSPIDSLRRIEVSTQNGGYTRNPALFIKTVDTWVSLINTQVKLLNAGESDDTSLREGRALNYIKVLPETTVFFALGLANGGIQKWSELNIPTITAGMSTSLAVTHPTGGIVVWLDEANTNLPVYTDLARTTKSGCNLKIYKREEITPVVFESLCLGYHSAFSGSKEERSDGGNWVPTTNQIVIGPYAVGNGSNSTVINNVGCKITTIAGTSTSKLEIAGNTLNINTTDTPTAGANGKPGDIRWDRGFLYVCTDVNTWKKAALTAV